MDNLSKARSVGFIKFEIDIRGKQNLESAPRKMVLNKSAALAMKNLSGFRKYRKPAAKTKEPKFQWNQKMKVI